MITVDGDDACTFDQQPHVRIRNDAELTAESPSYPTPTDSSAGGHSDPCEQLIESRSTRSTSPLSLEPNSALVVAAAAGFECLLSTHVADGALAEVLPDGQSYMVGVARTVGLLTYRAKSERASWTDCTSTPISTWTSGQDEQLLHLRDVAQLKWRNIVSYFPGMTVDAIKGRYKHLNGSRMTCETMGDEPKPRVETRKRTSYLVSLIARTAAKKCRASSRTESRKQPISILLEHHATPHRGRVTKRAKRTKYVASLVAATYEDAC
jgi:hypothetical protein